MIDTLNAHFESRIEELPELIRARVMKSIANGATAASRYEISNSFSRCVLSGDVPEILWTVAFTPAEAGAIGDEVCNVLNTLPVEAQQGLDDKLNDGATMFVIVEHQTRRAQIYYDEQGESHLLAEMEAPAPVWQ
jgi:hypothetical protein